MAVVAVTADNVKTDVIFCEGIGVEDDAIGDVKLPTLVDATVVPPSKADELAMPELARSISTMKIFLSI